MIHFSIIIEVAESVFVKRLAAAVSPERHDSSRNAHIYIHVFKISELPVFIISIFVNALRMAYFGNQTNDVTEHRRVGYKHNPSLTIAFQ